LEQWRDGGNKAELFAGTRIPVDHRLPEDIIVGRLSVDHATLGHQAAQIGVLGVVKIRGQERLTKVPSVPNASM